MLADVALRTCCGRAETEVEGVLDMGGGEAWEEPEKETDEADIDFLGLGVDADRVTSPRYLLRMCKTRCRDAWASSEGPESGRAKPVARQGWSVRGDEPFGSKSSIREREGRKRGETEWGGGTERDKDRRRLQRYEVDDVS